MVLKIGIKSRPDRLPPAFMDSLTRSIMGMCSVGGEFSSEAVIVSKPEDPAIRISVSQYPVRLADGEGRVVSVEYKPAELVFNLNTDKPNVARIVDGRYTDEPVVVIGERGLIEKAVKGGDLVVVFGLSPERIHGIVSSELMAEFLYAEDVAVPSATRKPLNPEAPALVQQAADPNQAMMIADIARITGRNPVTISQCLMKRGVNPNRATLKDARNYVGNMRSTSDEMRGEILHALDKHAIKLKSGFTGRPPPVIQEGRPPSQETEPTYKFSEIYKIMRGVDPDMSYRGAQCLFYRSGVTRAGNGRYNKVETDDWLAGFAKEWGAGTSVLDQPAAQPDNLPAKETAIDVSRYPLELLKRAFDAPDDDSLRSKLSQIGIGADARGAIKGCVDRQVISRMDLNAAEKILGVLGHNVDRVLELHYAHGQEEEEHTEPKIIDLGGTIDIKGLNRIYASLAGFAGIRPLINHGRVRRSDLALFGVSQTNQKIRDAILDALGLPKDVGQAKHEIGRYIEQRPNGNGNGYTPFTPFNSYTADQIGHLKLDNGDAEIIRGRMGGRGLKGYEIAQILYDNGRMKSLRNFGYEGGRDQLGGLLRRQARDGKRDIIPR